MSNQHILSNQKIASDQWAKFFDQFTHNHRGRLIKLEIVNQERGDEIAIGNSSLWSLVYAPVPQDNQLLLTTVQYDLAFAHNILAPKIVWAAEDADGQVVALEVIDESNAQTILSLK